MPFTVSKTSSPFTFATSEGKTLRLHGAITEIKVEGSEALEGITVNGNNSLSRLYADNCPKLKNFEANSCDELYQIRLRKLEKFTGLTLQNLPKLQQVQCQETAVTELAFSNLTALENLFCKSNSGLTTMTVSGCDILKNLNCSNGGLETLSVTGCSALEKLDCSRNKLSVLSIDDGAANMHLHCEYNELTTLDVSKLATKLQNLYCCNNLLTKLDLSANSALGAVECQENQISTLNVGKSIRTIRASHNKIATFDVSALTNLYELRLEHNGLTSLTGLEGAKNLLHAYLSNNRLSGDWKLPEHWHLKGIVLENNQLESLDLSNLKRLLEINVSNNQLRSLTPPPQTNTDFREIHLYGNRMSTKALDELFCALGRPSTPGTIYTHRTNDGTTSAVAESNGTPLKSRNWTLKETWASESSEASKNSTEIITTGTVSCGTPVMPVPSIGITPNTPQTLTMGQTISFGATIGSAATSTYKNYFWWSSDPTVASIDKDGKVTAISTGSTNIMAITNDGTKSAQVAIEVTNATPTIPTGTQEITLGVKKGETVSIKLAAAADENVYVQTDANTYTLIQLSKTAAKFAFKALEEAILIHGKVSELLSAQNEPNLYSITTRDATALTKVDMYLATPNLAKVDLQSAANLQDIRLQSKDLPNSALKEINLHGLNKLQSVNISHYPELTTLNVTGCDAITYLSCEQAKISSIDLSNKALLNQVDLEGNRIEGSINLAGCKQLHYLRVQRNQIAEINVAGCTGLKRLEAEENQLTKIDLTNCSSVEKVSVWGNAFTSTSLDELYCTLPTSTTSATLAVLENDSDPETPEITNSNSTIATGKNWKVTKGKYSSTPVTTTGTGACGGSTTPITGISLSPSPMALAYGASQSLTATITPTTATYQQIAWSSGAPHIADVDANGVVYGRGTGSAIITASATDGSGVTATCTVFVAAEKPPIQWTITASAGTGGSISPSGEVTVEHGKNQSFTITAEANHVIDALTVDGANVADAAEKTSHTYEFENVTANHTIEVTFKKTASPQYTITIAPTTNGTITTSPSGKVNAGETITITTSPKTGYKPKEGSLRVYKTDDERVTVSLSGKSFKMPAYGVTVTAEFIPEEPTPVGATPSHLTLFPNPAKWQLTIAGLETPAQVVILNSLGMKMLLVNLQPGEPIDISALPEGVYMLLIDGTTLRFIKE